MITVPWQNGEICGGLDLSCKWDLTCWAMAQRNDINGYNVNCRFFIARDQADLIERRDHVPYSTWVKQGYVTLCGSKTISYTDVMAVISKDVKEYKIRKIGFDKWNADKLSEDLENELRVKMITISQQFAGMSAPSKEFYRCVIEHTLRHGNNPVLNWCANNVEVKCDDSGNIKPVKPDHDSSTRKIDGIVASIMAIGLAMHSPKSGVSIADVWDEVVGDQEDDSKLWTEMA